MPPRCRNHRDPTGPDTPTATAASSLVRPSAILTQNARSTSRRGGGRPGDRIGARPVFVDIHAAVRPIVTPLLIGVLRRPLESALTALVAVEDHAGDRLPATAHRDRHGQRIVGQLGVVVLAEGEPDDAPRTHVQHRVQEQLALVGDDLGAVAVPLAIQLVGREVPADQVRRPPPPPALAGGLLAPLLPPGDEVLVAHDLRDGVLADPLPGLMQVGGDPRGAVSTVMLGEQPGDLGGQRDPAGVLRRGVAVPPLVEPRLADAQRPAGGRVRHLMLLPPGGDKGGHRYRPIASSTQRATERLSTSRCIRSSVTSSVHPHQLGALVLAQRRVAVLPPAALAGAPVAQRALVDPQIPGHLRDRLAGLEHQLHRTVLEVRIELPVLPAHRSSSKRCLHATRGSPATRSPLVFGSMLIGALHAGGVMRFACCVASDEEARWRVFVSHTDELREFPRGSSYVSAVERGISAAGHVIVNMADFPAADQLSAQLCIDRVRGCEVYVGLLGTRYGSPVRDRPEVSYTELEFDTATQAALDRLVFLLDTEADNLCIPLSQLIDRDFGSRQDAFRRRVRESGLTTRSFANPDQLARLVERSLRELAETRRRERIGIRREQVPAEPQPVRASKFLNPPPATAPTWFQDRQEETELLARYITDPGIRMVTVVGRGGIGKTAMVCRLLKG